MLIIDQTRHLAVNSDQCATFYIEKRTVSIKARLAIGGDAAVVTLASYTNLSICEGIFAHLCKRVYGSYDYFELPATYEEIKPFLPQ